MGSMKLPDDVKEFFRKQERLAQRSAAQICHRKDDEDCGLAAEARWAGQADKGDSKKGAR